MSTWYPLLYSSSQTVPPTQLILSPFYTNSLLPIQIKFKNHHNNKTKTNSKHHKDRHQNHHHQQQQKHHHHHHHEQKHQANTTLPSSSPSVHNVSSSASSSSSSSTSLSPVIEVSEGEKIMLKCRTSSMTKPLTRITWTRNGIAFADAVQERIVQEDDEKKAFMTESTVHLYVKLKDSGSNYKCLAHHPGLSPEKVVSDDITLSIVYAPGKPEIEGYAAGEEILKAGDKITLACMSRGGNPPPTLIWYRESEVVDSSSSLISSSPDAGGGGGVTTNTYSLTVKPEDNRRTFRCEASNIIQTLSSDLRLDVHFPPVNIKINGPSVGRINDILRYECIIGPSNPLPSQITWLINGLPQKQGVYPVENWMEEVSFGFMTKTNITVLLSESINSIACEASSFSSSSSTTSSPSSSSSSPVGDSNKLQYSSVIQASIDVHVLCKNYLLFSLSFLLSSSLFFFFVICTLIFFVNILISLRFLISLVSLPGKKSRSQLSLHFPWLNSFIPSRSFKHSQEKREEE